MERKDWQRPQLQVLDTVVELTGSLDKVGSAFDYVTQTIPDLDGDIFPD